MLRAAITMYPGSHMISWTIIIRIQMVPTAPAAATASSLGAGVVLVVHHPPEDWEEMRDPQKNPTKLKNLRETGMIILIHLIICTDSCHDYDQTDVGCHESPDLISLVAVGAYHLSFRLEIIARVSFPAWASCWLLLWKVMSPATIRSTKPHLSFMYSLYVSCILSSSGINRQFKFG